MKKVTNRIIVILMFLISMEVLAQNANKAVTKDAVLSLKSERYIACPGSVVTLEVVYVAGNTYAWYSAKTGGSLLSSDAIVNYTKTTAIVDTVWLQVNNNERVPVLVYLSSICGSVTDLACPTGTILFKEDFGGNSPTDNSCGVPISTTITSYSYSCTPAGFGLYGLLKTSMDREYWTPMDDHTYPNDKTRGYLYQVDASKTAGVFYKCDINNLCVGSHLTFSAWMSSVIRNFTAADFTNTIFELSTPDGRCISRYYTGNLKDNYPIWQQFGFDFTVPNDVSSLILKIINNGTGSAGNDFVLDDCEIRLCVPPVTVAISPNDTICEGIPVDLKAKFTNDGSFAEPLAYKWFKKKSPNSWNEFSSGSELSLSSAQLADGSIYRVVVSSVGNIDNASCRAMSDSVYLKVNPIKRKVITDSVCIGQSYPFCGKNLSIAGVYNDTIESSLGCDSIVTLTLKTMPSVTKTLDITINKGESYYFGDEMITSSGQYTHTLQNILGCDSLVILNLSVSNNTISIPEIFTPNEDGLNDYFKIINIDQFPKNHLLIFNRWGNKLFDAEPYLNDWNGRAHSGVIVGDGLLPVGTYFYILDLGDGSPARKGFIYLNR